MAESAKKNRYISVGRRKTATAKVALKAGDGRILVNGKDYKKYFPNLTLQVLVLKPLEAAGVAGKMNVKATITGGGVAGQADALRHGIARALVVNNPDVRPVLSKAGLMKRDPRMVERKKYGQAGARKRFQFSKR